MVTGITDLDYNEVLAGLKPGDQVYLLPSSGLVETQQRFQQQMRQFTGMPGMTGGGRQGSRPESGQQPAARPRSADPECRARAYAPEGAARRAPGATESCCSPR